MFSTLPTNKIKAPLKPKETKETPKEVEVCEEIKWLTGC